MGLCRTVCVRKLYLCLNEYMVSLWDDESRCESDSSRLVSQVAHQQEGHLTFTDGDSVYVHVHIHIHIHVHAVTLGHSLSSE